MIILYSIKRLSDKIPVAVNEYVRSIELKWGDKSGNTTCMTPTSPNTFENFKKGNPNLVGMPVKYCRTGPNFVEFWPKSDSDNYALVLEVEIRP